MIVVFDTNILISSLLSPSGNEARAVSLFLQRQVVAAVSTATLAEYDLVLSRRKFSFVSSKASELLYLISTFALKTEPHGILTLSPDDSDNRFIEWAEAASADFLITGNKRHFPASHGKTKIVNAREFLDALQAL
ncbi:MAG TPA: putative toxin-antitoxin system toxin component, PIN family [Edaphobacter sp.]|nr:putative toxin-antitoxin system toxin component, PIN family [Edaphobacter sp.]